MFDPRSSDGRRKKVTLLEILLRLTLMLGPIIYPPLVSDGDFWDRYSIPLVWVCFGMPIWIGMIADVQGPLENWRHYWEENAQPFRPIMNFIGFVFSGAFLFGIILMNISQ